MFLNLKIWITEKSGAYSVFVCCCFLNFPNYFLTNLQRLKSHLPPILSKHSHCIKLFKTAVANLPDRMDDQWSADHRLMTAALKSLIPRFLGGIICFYDTLICVSWKKNNIFLLTYKIYVLESYFYHAIIDFGKWLSSVENIRKLHRKSFEVWNLCSEDQSSNVLLIVIYHIAYLV